MHDTIYDDVFRTMAQKMPHLFVALINEVFGTDFSEDAEIITCRNEFYTKKGKIITDSIFYIEGRLFHIECQSNPDNTMAIRMFEYDFAIALEKAVTQGEPYEVKLPESCVVYIRDNSNTPDVLTVNLTINGIEVPYSSKVVKVASYSLQDLISKKLKILLPYYMVRYEHLLPDDFVGKYVELLESANDNLAMSEKDIVDFIKQVAERVAPSDEARKEVSDMGGKVLELWSERVAREGEEKGRKLERFDLLYELVEDGSLSVDAAAKKLNITPEDFKNRMSLARK